MRVSVSDRGPEQLAADACVVLFRDPERGRWHPPLLEHLRPAAGRWINRSVEASTWLETRELPTPRVLFHSLPSAPADWDPELEYLGGHAGSFGRDAWALQRRRSRRQRRRSTACQR